MRLRTRVFELAFGAGYFTDQSLARAMGVHITTLCLVKKNETDPGSPDAREPSRTFILGALRAFPGKTMDDLFYTEPDPITSRNTSEREVTGVAGA